MGLDMYLTAERYLTFDDERTQRRVQDIVGSPHFKANSVSIEIGYWRKHNHIHNWFVENIQDGNDNCEKYELSTDDLRSLLKDVKLAQKSKHPEKILPPREGFFFGSDNVDDYYKEGLNMTREIIEKWLEFADKDKYVLSYQSSW